MTVSGQVDRAPSDAVLARLARAQHGVFGRWQLVELGLHGHDIDHRLRVRRLHRLYRGVYALAPPPTLALKGRWMAGVLALGPDAVLSHATAAALWDLRRSQAAVIDVTVPSYAGRRRRRGIRLHRSATLTDDQRTTRDAIPVTSVARTLIDIADRFDLRTVERATDQAEVLGLFDLVAVERAIAIGAGRKGSRVMKRLLDEYTAGAGMTESDLEDEFLRLCDRFGIRRPEVQVWFGPDRADFFWPDVNLVVETDSWRWHGGRAAWEADQRKVLRLEIRGLRVRRVSYRRVLCEPAEVAAELELIGAPSEGPRPGE